MIAKYKIDKNEIFMRNFNLLPKKLFATNEKFTWNLCSNILNWKLSEIEFEMNQYL